MSPSDFATWLFTLGTLLLFLVSSAQGALVFIDRARLRRMLDEEKPRVQTLIRLLDEPTSTVSSLVFLHTLAVAVAAAAGFWLDTAWWPASQTTAVLLAVLELLILLVVQSLGRLLALWQPTRLALAFLGPVSLLGLVLLPLVAPEQAARRRLRAHRQQTDPDADERFIHLMNENTDLEEEERDMITSVIELGEQPVREAMVPRIDVAALASTCALREVLDKVVETGHSRLPLYEETIDNIVGVMYAKDLLRHLRDGSLDGPALPLAREPYFVPETKKVDDLMREMQQKRVHLAVVVDEYGGTAGLVSIEDLIEEIVGEIQDEYDVEEEAPIEQISPTEAIFDARVSIRDVNDTLDLELSDEDFDTIGGLLYHALGKVPTVGDEVQVGGCLVTVLSASGRRIRKVRVMKSSAVPG